MRIPKAFLPKKGCNSPLTPPDQNDSDGHIAVEISKPKVAEPPRYAVFLHNDDYTTMEFVVEVLTVDFSRPYQEAMSLMLKVHEEGKAVAGIYSFEIAETKVAKVTEKARASGFPLKLSLEPVGA